jgi:hypothetical protein
MDAVDVLMEARAYIEKGWCQAAYARTLDGRFVDPTKDEAATRCARGAILAGTGVFGSTPEGLDAIRLLAKAARVRADNLSYWNDDSRRTQNQVLKAFDRAIALGLDEAS